MVGRASGVWRQPNVRIASTTAGITSPPTPIPTLDADSALARLRSNHRTVSLTTVMNPASPAPAEIRKNEITSSTGVLIRLNHTNPTSAIREPTRITRRDPKRSSAHPWIGPSRPLSARLDE
jgi:hypothetical protein